MNVLNLIIKQKFFDEILAGTKTEEYREVRPTTFKKYCHFVVNDQLYDDLKDYEAESEGDYEYTLTPKQFDAIRFYVGYNKDRDSALVEVTDAVLEFLVDENDDNYTYEYKGVTYLVCQMVYSLGKVLEKDVHPKK